MKRTLSLFESATGRGRVVRQGDLVQIIIDGGGALVTTSVDFRAAQKWAQSKPATGNLISDRGRFFEQIGALVSRPGTMAPTRGNSKQLEGLARLMKQGGYDLGEWMLPPELKNVGHVTLPGPRAARDAKDDVASTPVEDLAADAGDKAAQ